MLPLLYKYSRAHILCSDASYPPSILLPPKVKESLFSEAIECIRDGKIAGEN
jgi:hypothetical protein